MIIKNQRGVTMMELLLVITLATLIMSMGFGSYRTWQRRILLINTRDEIKSSLVRAQQLATAAADGSSWGMHFTASSYTIFPGDTYDQFNVDNKTWNISDVEIQNPNFIFSDALGILGPDVVFSKFDGEAHNTGTVSIIWSSDPSYNKSVEVKRSGQVN